MREKTIVVNGLSKSHSMTGWRIGFLFAPAYLSKELLKIHLYNSVCASSISQHAAIEALTQSMNDAEVMVEEYRKRRDFFCGRLTDMGMDVVKPEGTFYVFPSIKRTNIKSLDFAMNLIQEAGVAIIPGDAFSEYGEGYIRISYAASMERLEKDLLKMEQYLHSLSVK